MRSNSPWLGFFLLLKPMSTGLLLIIIPVWSAGCTFVINWLGLIPWRRSKDQHWTERARLYFPVRSVAISNLWVFPALTTILCIIGRSSYPELFPPWPAVALFSAAGTLVGTVPMDREVFPRIAGKSLWRQVALGFLVRFLLWFVFLAALALMPDEFNLLSLLIFGAVVLLWLLWNRGLSIKTMVALGWLCPPPERLTRIVHSCSERMQVPVQQTWLMKSSLAQAYAMPGRSTLIFSERLLEVLSDEEIAAVCHHELAHLTEPRRVVLTRYAVGLATLPWVLIKPMLGTLHEAGFYLLLLNTLLTPYLYRKLSVKMEKRADEVAKTNEESDGVYARALLRLHEDNLLPAVMGGSSHTHPHLYDRLVAAGTTPDFPRPKPAARSTIYGTICSGALGYTTVQWIISFTKH
jgi:Zn-dependent protease with chaperone function